MNTYLGFDQILEALVKKQTALSAETLRTATSTSDTGKLLLKAGHYQGLEDAIQTLKELKAKQLRRDDDDTGSTKDSTVRRPGL